MFAEDAAGNRGNATLSVSFAAPPPPALTARISVSDNPQVNQPVVFDGSTSSAPNGASLSYSWNFSDGVQLSGMNVSRIFNQATSINVTLTVSSGTQSDQASRQVDIAAPTPKGTATLSGEVIDDDQGALPGVQIVDASGQPLATSDAFGRFQITIDRAVPVVLRYQRDGWVDQIQRLMVPESADQWRTQAQLIRQGETVLLPDAAAGGDVLTSDGVRVSFPADALVDDQGVPVSGAIAVRITPLDTSDADFAAFPGGPMAVGPQGELGVMATYGVMEVVLHQDDNKVFIADGKKATIEIPMATPAATGAQIDLWSLDESSGLWINEGQGTVIQANGGSALRAEVSHFSWWNADDFIALHEALLGLSKSGNAIAVNGPVQVTGSTPPDVPGPRSQVSLTLQDLTQPVPIRLPIGLEIELVATADDGKLRCTGRFIPSGNENAYTLDCVDLSDPAEPTRTALSYGDTVVHSFTTEGQEQRFVFDAQAGDLARIRLRSINAARAQAVIVSAGGWEILPTRVSASNTQEIIYPVAQDRTVVIAVRAGDLPGDIELALDKVTESSIEQEQVINVNANSTGTKTWTFWANAGQTLHVRFFGTVPFGSVQLLHEGQTVATTNQRFGSVHSWVYEIAETGLYVLQQDILGGVNAQGVQYAFSITDMPPPSYAASDRAVFFGDLAVPGKVRRYVSAVSASDAILARPRAAAGQPEPHLSERLGFSGNWTASARSIEPTQGSFALSKIGPAVSGEQAYFHAVFHTEGDTGAFEIDIQRQAEVANLRVGDSNCADADTVYLPLAVAAVSAGGTINLCDGTHQTFDGIRHGQGAVLIGGGISDAILRGWQERRLIESGVSGLQGLSLMLDGRDGVSMTYDRGNPLPLRLQDVRVIGNANTSSNTAIAVLASGSSTDPDDIQLTGINVNGPIGTGISLSDLQGVSASTLSVTDASTQAIALGNTDGVTLSNIFLDNVRSGVMADLGRVSNTTIDGGIIALGHSPSAGFGVSLMERANNNAAAGSSVVRGLDITLARDGDTGISIELGEDPAQVRVEQNLIDGENYLTRGIWIQPVVNSSGTLEILNNVLLEHDRHAVDVSRADRLNEFELTNNSIANSSASANPIHLVNLNLDTDVSVGSYAFFNNLFVGHGSNLDRAVVLNVAVPITADHNLFWNLASSYTAGGAAVSNGSNDVSGEDPLISNRRLELLPGSPAVDAGNSARAPAADFDGTLRPQGAAADIGAHER